MFNPRQPRAGDGRWSRVSVRDLDDVLTPRRRRKGASEIRNRRADIKSDVAVVKAVHRGATPTIPRAQRGRVESALEYLSPKARAAARAATGTARRPRAEAIQLTRGRRTAASAAREVAFNPLAGRFTAQPGQGGTRASAARARAQRAPVVSKTPEYIGKRRRKD